MKTGKKIAVGLAAALVVAIFAAGAVSMVGAQLLPVPINYTVTVSGIDVSIAVVNTNFGVMLPGAAKNLTPSFRLTNGGGLDAQVDAAFTTQEGGTYGFTGGSVINATYFKINDLALKDNGSDARVTDADADETTDYDTGLAVPAEQEAAAYTATVELTFSAIVPT